MAEVIVPFSNVLLSVSTHKGALPVPLVSLEHTIVVGAIRAIPGTRTMHGIILPHTNIVLSRLRMPFTLAMTKIDDPGAVIFLSFWRGPSTLTVTFVLFELTAVEMAF